MWAANVWRWGYVRPPDVSSPGVAARKIIRPGITRQTGREWQAEQVRRTGFVQHAETAHAVVEALLRRGYSRTVATVAGHLAAVGSRYNWQGNRRISELTHWSHRTAQRARAELEAGGFIRSHLLLTGDHVPGQRAPVWHPQVVRDVTRLQRIAAGQLQRSTPPHRREAPKPRPSVATAVPLTADELQELAREVAPEFAVFFQGMADAKRRDPPRDAPAEIDPREIDECERAIAELEQSRAPTGRGPPRGPPDSVN